VAYDKAVEVVIDAVRQETHKEDIRLVEESKEWVLSSERKAPKKEWEYAVARLDGVITKIKNAMQNALAKIRQTLMQPEVKQAGKEQIRKELQGELAMDRSSEIAQFLVKDLKGFQKVLYLIHEEQVIRVIRFWAHLGEGTVMEKTGFVK